jgi:hypothetical protein
MNEAEFTTCAWCPRLCRHVCPVAVGAALESATPTALMSAPLFVAGGIWTREVGVSATDLCLGCHACTQHCKLHVPVPERLAEWRATPTEPAPLAPIEGDAQVVCVHDGVDWSERWARGAPVSRIYTRDDLGHAAWRSGSLAVIASLADHFRGRRVVTVSGAVEEVLRAAGVPVERVAIGEGRVFRTCFEGAAPGPEQLACCGRREGFAERNPSVAAAIARENVRLLDGPAVCKDQGCAAWLRANGGDVVGPLDTN